MLNSIPTMVDLRSRYCRYILAQGWPLNILKWCSIKFGFAASPRWRQPPLFAALTAPETIEISGPSDQRRCHQIAHSRAQAAIAIPPSAGRKLFESRRWICVNLDHPFINF